MLPSHEDRPRQKYYGKAAKPFAVFPRNKKFAKFPASRTQGRYVDIDALGIAKACAE